VDLALGDLDGDGDLDAFVGNAGGNNFVWLNDGSGNFNVHCQRIGGGLSSCGVALGDVDGAGGLDAFIANASTGPNQVWLSGTVIEDYGDDGICVGMFKDSGQRLGSSDSRSVALGDVDGDGDLDAFVANDANQPNRVWVNDGSGIFSDSGQRLGSLTTKDIALGDVDGDGDLDAFAANTAYNEVWLNDGAGTFADSGQTLGNAGSHGVALGDLDGDGDLDSFVANYNNAANMVWLNGGGMIAGHVFAVSVGNPLKGALVQVCDAAGVCRITATNFLGRYMVSGLEAGDYVVTVFSPTGIDYLPGRIGPLTLPDGGSLTDQDIVLTGPTPPPRDTTITSRRTGGGAIPMVYWREDLTLTTQGCAGGTASYEIFKDRAVVRSGWMTEGPATTHTAIIPQLDPFHGYARVVITIHCPDSTTSTILFDIYIDPSGHVRTVDGEPIDGATVTLFRSDSPSGPFVQVPDGSGIMSLANRNNPDLTDADGRFGWDVFAGFYKVRGEKEGCVSPTDPSQTFVESAVLTVPPAITDLDLRLDCIPPNQPPTADAGGPYEGDEGSVITLDASGSSDPDGTIVLYEWDLDNDGAYDDATTVSVDIVFDDNDSFTVGLRVADDLGESDTDTVGVTVFNVAPSVEAGPDQTNYQDAVFSLAPATFADPGVGDSHTATIDWGDGTVEAGTVSESDGSGTVSGSHTYVDDGTYTVEVCVTDDDGGTGCDTFQVVVLNVPPSVEAGPDQTVDEGGTLSLAPATFMDPDVEDTHTATIDWGDDSPVEAGTVSESDGSGTASGSHVYGDNGTYNVTVTVCDDDGGCGEDSFTVIVNNVVPAVNADPATQEVQYSDPIATVTIAATDVANDSLQVVATDWSVNGGSFTAGLPPTWRPANTRCGSLWRTMTAARRIPTSH